ncbi:autotransporter beta-domain protein [Orientia chuto str. Dubai]|uniref:Autotransporter beta-domain protein n=1 Tax=Orientia chuto str. Dubai TaxID=1359168 RepID=A0A0F3MR96_9RICK|nr:autotransporter domain-containing protein [Candidatus Orientia mediorientalis]KJV57109.1 autotransporter beta-domain protein [Orientia chuto str. Dubai]
MMKINKKVDLAKKLLIISALFFTTAIQSASNIDILNSKINQIYDNKRKLSQLSQQQQQLIQEKNRITKQIIFSNDIFKYVVLLNDLRNDVNATMQSLNEKYNNDPNNRDHMKVLYDRICSTYGIISKIPQEVNNPNNIVPLRNKLQARIGRSQNSANETKHINEDIQDFQQKIKQLGDGITKFEQEITNLPSIDNLSIKSVDPNTAGMLRLINMQLNTIKSGINSILAVQGDAITHENNLISLFNEMELAINSAPNRLNQAIQDLEVFKNEMKNMIDLISALRTNITQSGAPTMQQAMLPDFADMLANLSSQLDQQARQISAQSQDLLNQLNILDIARTSQQYYNQELDILQQQLEQQIKSFKSQQQALQAAITNHDKITSNINFDVISTARDVTTLSLSKLTAEQTTLPAMISSGSNISNCWNIDGNIFFGKVQQKGEKNYNTSINGAFITVNKYLSEKVIIGATGLYSNLDFIHDQSSATTSNAYLFSLNSKYLPQQNVFIQGILGVIKYDSIIRYYDTVQPSDSMGYYSDCMLGGNLYPLKQHHQKIIVSPVVGIMYTNLKDYSHTFFNKFIIGDRSHDILTGRAGIMIKYAIENNNMSIVPEFYSYIHRLLYTNSSNMQLKYDDDTMPQIFIVSEPAKQMPELLYQLGGAITIWSNQIGLGVSGNIYLSKEEYISYIGSIYFKARF